MIVEKLPPNKIQYLHEKFANENRQKTWDKEI